MAASVGQGQKIRTRPGEEIWDSTTASTVWVQVTDEKGKARDVMVRGFGRLRISTEDREIIQESCVEPDLDVFTNGMLVRSDRDQDEDPRTQSVNAMTTEEIMAIFEKTGDEFVATVEPLNEVAIRRLREVAEDVDATASQLKYLDDLIEERYAVGGDVPSYRELRGLGQVAGSQ